MLDQADEAQLRKLAGAYRLSQAIAVAAELRLADLVADTPKTADELAPEVGAHPPTLYRLLRALAGEGIFAESEEGCFSLAPLGRFLVSRRPDSARAMIEGWRCLAEGYRAFGHLRHTVLTGEPGFVAAHGTSFYDYMDLHPERLALYDAATNSTVDSFIASVDAYDFSTVRTVVDVGGGLGAFLVCLCQRYPSVRGVLFERPSVIASAGKAIMATGFADRITCEAGDLFHQVPPGADAHVMITVLRCFDDVHCLAALRACAAAMPHHGRLLVLEMVMPSKVAPDRGLADLQALMVYGGADRTETEWARLFGDAGLQLSAVLPTAPPYSWLEGRLARAPK